MVNKSFFFIFSSSRLNSDSAPSGRGVARFATPPHLRQASNLSSSSSSSASSFLNPADQLVNELFETIKAKRSSLNKVGGSSPLADSKVFTMAAYGENNNGDYASPGAGAVLALADRMTGPADADPADLREFCRACQGHADLVAATGRFKFRSLLEELRRAAGADVGRIVGEMVVLVKKPVVVAQS